MVVTKTRVENDTTAQRQKLLGLRTMFTNISTLAHVIITIIIIVVIVTASIVIAVILSIAIAITIITLL